MTRLLGILAALALVLGSASAVQAAPADSGKRDAPSRQQWLQDVKVAMKRSDKYLRNRVAAAAEGDKLAINLDIDNSSLTTYYDGVNSVAIPRVKRFTDLAESLGVRLVFNTGRVRTPQHRKDTMAQLAAAGFDVAKLCMRDSTETLAASKQRCRAAFVSKGLVLIANVGNKSTDFVGGNYERAYRLPNYGVMG